MEALRPRDEASLIEAIAIALRDGTALELVAGGSKRGIGHPVDGATRLDLTAFAGIRDYDPAELVLTAGPATPLAEIERALADRGQMLAFEPPRWDRLFGLDPATQPTLGGVLSGNLSGPRRIAAGGARDHMLGLRAVSGRAEAFKAGGKVVKNVTGYDLPKLLCGAWGTLAAMTEVTVKVLPAPPVALTLALDKCDAAAAGAAMTDALQGPEAVSGAAHLPATVSPTGAALTLLRIEGGPSGALARAEDLAGRLAAHGSAHRLKEAEGRALWADIAELRLLPPAGPLWRLSVPPASGGRLAERLMAERPDARLLLDCGGGRLWVSLPEAESDGGAESLRRLITDGHATLIRGSEALRRRIPVFHPQPGPLAALEQRLRHQFDPAGLLNPGRMRPVQEVGA